MNQNTSRATTTDANSEGKPRADQYDLSFAYTFQWDEPETQIREALKVLLCNREEEAYPKEDRGVAVKSRKKPQSDSSRAAALEAAKIRWLLAINPNTPPPVLEHLTREATSSLLERIAENPRTHASTLSRLATHADAQVRAAVAENMNTSMKTMWKLVRDECPDVRYRLAESYNVPIAVLKVLAEDENPYVAHRAQMTALRILAEVTELRTA